MPDSHWIQNQGDGNQNVMTLPTSSGFCVGSVFLTCTQKNARGSIWTLVNLDFGEEGTGEGHLVNELFHIWPWLSMRSSRSNLEKKEQS